MGNDLEVMLKVRQQGIETFDRATTALKGLFAAYIGIAGARQFINFSIDAAKAFDDEEKSNRKLINALKEKNLYTAQSFAFYKDFAEKQMFVIGKSHEEIEAVQTLLVQYGVYGPLVNKTTSAIIDLAAAKGIDLSTATNLVLRGLESEKGGLKGITSHLDGAAGSAERLASIYEVLVGKFKGSGAAGASELDKLNLKFEEMKEEWGKTTLPVYIKFLEAGTDLASLIMHPIDAIKKQAYGKGGIFEGKGPKTAAQRRAEILSSAVDMNTGKTVDLSQEGGGVNAPTMTGEELEKIAIAAMKTQTEIEEQRIKNMMDRAAWEKKYNEDSDKAFMDSEEEKLRIASENLQAWDRIYMERRQLEEAQLQASLEAQRQGAMAIGAAMAAGIGQGKDGFKESAKAVLITTIDLMEKKAQAMLIIQSLWDWSGLAKLAAVTFAFEALKKGISGFAGGTTYAPGGWAMVGERGPELMNVPRGSQIYNNQQTRNMTTNNKPSVTLNVYGGGGNLQSQLERGVRSKEIDFTRILETAGIRLG